MKYFVANWKMYLTRAEAVELTNLTVTSHISNNNARVILCPSFVHLETVGEILTNGNEVALGAQDAYFESIGAFTSAVSVAQLKELTVSYVLVGHSERRQYFGETDESVNKKIKTLFVSGLQPILCVGETAVERSNGKTYERVDNQLKLALKDIKISHIIIAYEPVWSIGTGITPVVDDATAVHKYIKDKVKEYSGAECDILYGGSVTPENLRDFWNAQNIDGVLVGGASTKKDKLLSLLSLISN